MSHPRRGVLVPPLAEPPTATCRPVAVADATLDISTASAWGERLRATCRSLAHGAYVAGAPVLMMDLRPVRLLCAAAVGELVATREYAATIGVDVVLLLERGRWAHRVLRISGLAASFTVLGARSDDEAARR